MYVKHYSKLHRRKKILQRKEQASKMNYTESCLVSEPIRA